MNVFEYGEHESSSVAQIPNVIRNTIVIGKLQNVNIILLAAFPEATDTFSDAFIVCYSSKRCLYNRHFLKIA